MNVTYFAMTLAAAALMCGCGKGPIGITTPTPTTTLSGVVFETTSSGDEVPLPDAVVRNINSRDSTRTDQNGRYSLPATAPAGAMTVEISKWRFVAARENVTISGNTVADFRIARQPMRTLSGFVTEETETGQAPVEGVFVDVVLCQDQPFSAGFANTDENGFYSVPNLCDGQTVMYPYKKGYQLAPVPPLCVGGDGGECRYITIAGDTQFDFQLIKQN